MMSSSTPVLECAGLTKRYGKTMAVDNLNLEVHRGEIFGVLGANGAGKTTSVECAQGLRKPDGGTVRVLGHDPIADKARIRGRVGSQLQDASLPDRLRVGEAINLFADNADQAKRVFDDWDLDPIAKTAFGSLSGGQRQRLFLALALLNEPEVVFLDELTQGLDPAARREVLALIERVRERGTTVILVTHFMNEAESLCDRVAVMGGGRLIAEGSPSELIDRYGKGVSMRFAGDGTDIEWLLRVPLVGTAHVDQGEIEVCGPSPMIVLVGAELVARGAVPSEVRIVQPSLEDALLALIKDSDHQPMEGE